MKRYFVGPSNCDAFEVLKEAGKLTERGVGAVYLSSPTPTRSYAVGWEFDDSDTETVAMIEATGQKTGSFSVAPVQF